MLTEDRAEVRRRGEALIALLPPAAGADLIEGTSEVGGGSFPDVPLPTWVVRLHPAAKPDIFAERLRLGQPAVIARVMEDRVCLDPRTILPDQVPTAAAAVAQAVAAG